MQSSFFAAPLQVNQVALQVKEVTKKGIREVDLSKEISQSCTETSVQKSIGIANAVLEAATQEMVQATKAIAQEESPSNVKQLDSKLEEMKRANLKVLQAAVLNPGNSEI